MEFSKEILKGLLETLVLHVIAHQRMHGYLIARTIADMANGHLEIKDGTLYPILHRLEQRKLIKGSWIDDGSARKRKEYDITPDGLLALKNQAEQWKFLTGMLGQVVKGI